MKRFTIITALCVFLFPLDMPAQQETEAETKTETEDAAVVLAREVAGDVARFRELPWKSPANIASYDLAQLEAFVTKALDEELPDALAARQTRALSALRLVPPDFDFKKTLRQLLLEQIGGFYDPKTEQLRVIRRTGDGDGTGDALSAFGVDAAAMDRVVMAHELVHALQDQHFDLESYPLDLKDDDDLVVAIQSVVEGDATLAMMGLLLPGKVTSEQLFARGKQILLTMKLTGGLSSLGMAGMKEFEQAPPVLRELLMFPYMGGLAYCLAAGADERGMKGIDAALRSPPVSTEQILHPEKHLGAEPDWPQVLTLPDVASLLGGEVIYENVLGELQTRLLFEGVLKKRAAERVAAGWDGDRYALLARKSGPDMLVLMTTWDDAEEADEFQDALCTWVRHPEGTPDSLEADWVPLLVPFDDGTVSLVGRRGTDVVMMLRVPKDLAVVALRALFEDTTRKERREVPRTVKAK